MPKPHIDSPRGTPEQLRRYEADQLLVDEYDPSYIPGYSEIVKANDIAKADPVTMPDYVKRKYYKRIGADPQELPWEFRWVRVSSPGGTDSYRADADAYNQFIRRGYRQVNVESQDDFCHQFRAIRNIGFPPTATLQKDGTIRRFDVALFVVDGETARKLQREQEQFNEMFHGPENQPRYGEKTKIPFDFEESSGGSARITSSFELEES